MKWFKILSPLVVLIFSYFAIKPILLPGFFPVHDDTQPARVYEMTQSLIEGQFPVRWVQDLGYGYGYPLFNFYAPFPYYVGSIFNLIGFSAIDSTKIMYLVGIMLAALTMFFLGKAISGFWGGLVSSVLYTYAPYHAVQIYVRGAVGEYYAYAFLPLILLGILKIIQGKFKSGISIGSLGLAGVLLSHNILGMITLYLLFFATTSLFFVELIKVFIRTKSFWLVQNQIHFQSGQKDSGVFRDKPWVPRMTKLKYFLLLILLGLGLSAFFTLPAFMEKQYTKVETLTQDGSDYRSHFVYPDQLWDSPWGYAGSAAGREDGMSFKIGKIHLLFGLISLITVFIFFWMKKEKTDYFPFITFLLIILFLSNFLMLEQSKFLWEFLPGFAYIQYPWRFLNFSILILVVYSGLIFLRFKTTKKILISLVLIELTLWFNVKYFQPREFLSLTDDVYTSADNLRNKISSISDEYLPTDFINKEAVYSGLNQDDLVIKTLTEKSTIKKYELTALQDTFVYTNITAFPGWKLWIDSQNVTLGKIYGRLIFEFPAGSHRVDIKLESTFVQRGANTISILSLILLLYVSFERKGIFFPWRRKKV